MKTGIEQIATERQEQIEKHGYNKNWVEEHPEYYEFGEMSLVAGMLLASKNQKSVDATLFPRGWEDDCIKMLSKPYIERLVVAGALIAAEIDRLNEI